MNIVGINCFLNTSAVLVFQDNKIKSFALESEFTRKRDDFTFPENALHYCLEYSQLNLEQIDYWFFPHKPIMDLENKLIQSLNSWPRGGLEFYNFFQKRFLPCFKLHKRIQKFSPSPLLYIKTNPVESSEQLLVGLHLLTSFVASPLTQDSWPYETLRAEDVQSYLNRLEIRTGSRVANPEKTLNQSFVIFKGPHHPDNGFFNYLGQKYSSLVDEKKIPPHSMQDAWRIFLNSEAQNLYLGPYLIQRQDLSFIRQI